MRDHLRNLVVPETSSTKILNLLGMKYITSGCFYQFDEYNENLVSPKRQASQRSFLYFTVHVFCERESCSESLVTIRPLHQFPNELCFFGQSQ